MTPDDQDRLDRERIRALLASEDALRAEREAHDLRGQVADLKQRLREEHERLVGLRNRRSVRLAVGGTRRAGRLAEAIRSIGRRGPGDASAARSAASATPTASDDPRSLPARYRAAVTAALDQPSDARVPLRVVALRSGSDASVDGELLGRLATGLVGPDGQLQFIDALPEPDQADPIGAPDIILATDPGIDPVDLPARAIRILVGATDPARRSLVPWDLTIGPDDSTSQGLRTAIVAWLQGPRVAIRAASGRAATARAWGDTYFARDLATALGQAGWPARVYFHDRWSDAAVGTADVVIDLLGLYPANDRPGACRILWQISHPELGTPEAYASYDLAYVASDSFAARMAGGAGGVVVQPLHQATDPVRFHPDVAGPASELLMVANWRPGRRIVEDLLPTDHQLAVFGRGWTADRLDPRYLAGESIDNDALAGHYASAAIVLNDHWAGMRREGFISNRLYDAAAAGAFVISDDVDGLDEEFDGGVVAYRDRQHLHALIERFLADPAERRRLADRAREAVLDRHTFADRAARIIADARPILAASSAGQAG